MRGLLVLAMLMMRYVDEEGILKLASSAVASFGPCRTAGVRVDGQWRTGAGRPSCADIADLDAQVEALGPRGRVLSIPGYGWACAYALNAPGGADGYMLIVADAEPHDEDRFSIEMLVQQTGVAIANARLHARERATANELRAANVALARNMAIHERFTRVAVKREGLPGIAQAVHELTGYPVAIEDRFGNLCAWAGPNCPKPYPRDPTARRARLLERAAAAITPVRDAGRLLVVAEHEEGLCYVLALIDPGNNAGPADGLALETARTVLAMELARLQRAAETDLHLQRNLVNDLLDGLDGANVVSRAQSLGYDLGRTHRVLVIEARDAADIDDAFVHAVRRAARDCEVGSLVVDRAGTVVVLSHTDVPWERLHAAVIAELHTGDCTIGVGGRCEHPADFPRSLREAQLALKVQRAAAPLQHTTVFDDLGVYQVFADRDDSQWLEQFVTRWLGPLAEHDARNGAQLVATLGQYLECGGNYDATAKALAVHRNTLRYRLKGIREVTGYDLADPDIRFNLQLACRASRTLDALRAH